MQLRKFQYKYVWQKQGRGVQIWSRGYPGDHKEVIAGMLDTKVLGQTGTMGGGEVKGGKTQRGGGGGGGMIMREKHQGEEDKTQEHKTQKQKSRE